MSVARRLHSIALLIVACLFLTGQASGSFNTRVNANTDSDECERYKAELKRVEAEIESLKNEIEDFKKVLSPEYLVNLPDETVNGYFEYAEWKLAGIRENPELGESAYLQSRLEHWQDEVDFWAEVMTTKILRGSGIVKTKWYKKRQVSLNERMQNLKSKERYATIIKAEMVKLGCNSRTASGGGWTAVKRLDKSEIFFQYEWQINQIEGGNLHIVQTLVDTNKDFYRRFIGTPTEFTLERIGGEKYKLRRTVRDPETGDSALEAIQCQITNKDINCTGVRRGPYGYWFGIRGRKLN